MAFKKPVNFKSADIFRSPFDVQNSTDQHLQKEIIKDLSGNFRFLHAIK